MIENQPEKPRLKKEMYDRIFGYISAGLGVVVGLAWNEAIRELINELFPVAKDTLIVKFLYATGLTIAIVIVIHSLSKAVDKLGQ